MGRFFKWVVVPAAAAALGYLVVGPRLAGKVKIPDAVKERVGSLVSPSQTEDKKDDGPRVSVGVKPVEDDPPRRR